MPKAEKGSAKWLANKQKSKGLQRLRFYCQACERQLRDANAMKQHCLSESHVRQMQIIGQDPQRYIKEYTEEFKRDFLALLRTSHGEKPVHLNGFYQTYIAHKEHIHMNATRFNSLTELGKWLGREGICRVTEDDKGMYIAWIDDSPAALRRRDALKAKERQDRGDEDREQKAILEQVKRAHENAKDETEFDDEKRRLERKEGEKLSLTFAAKKPDPPAQSLSPQGLREASNPPAPATETNGQNEPPQTAAAPIKIGFGASAPKKGNVFSAKKNPLAAKKALVKEPPKKMSEMERIMHEELERKRKHEGQDGGGKKIKFGITS